MKVVMYDCMTIFRPSHLIYFTRFRSQCYFHLDNLTEDIFCLIIGI
jgi:hypothetical protein